MPVNKGKFRVVIVGGGTGGLCLAQGLMESGVAVEVYERDRTPTDRIQGYRLGINSWGLRALSECLPRQRFERLVRSAARPSRSVSFLDERLRRLMAIDVADHDREARNGRTSREGDLPVSRLTLRRALLEGLNEVVRFGKTFVRFEEGSKGDAVVAHFDDGSLASGDILVGADGASSRVRRQLLPEAQRVDTGILAVSGKVPLNEAVRAATPDPILGGPTLILGPRGRFLFANAIEYEPGRSGSGRSDEDRAALDGVDREEYVMWGFSARRAAFGSLPENADDLDARGASAWKSAVLALMKDWHPALLRLVESAGPATVTSFRVKTSVPVRPWTTRNVTLLGDALHNMTPFRGIGANVALRDAATLRRALVAVNRGTAAAVSAIGAYERDMVEYGFRAVRTSEQEMRRLHSERALARGLTKTMFRVLDRLPPLKEALHHSM
jgi:2-polyprenyl-6-methoxyphenol hydroxylase-like FAD-dependent oxidoreductase